MTILQCGLNDTVLVILGASRNEDNLCKNDCGVFPSLYLYAAKGNMQSADHTQNDICAELTKTAGNAAFVGKPCLCSFIQFRPATRHRAIW